MSRSLAELLILITFIRMWFTHKFDKQSQMISDFRWQFWRFHANKNGDGRIKLVTEWWLTGKGELSSTLSCQSQISYDQECSWKKFGDCKRLLTDLCEPGVKFEVPRWVGEQAKINFLDVWFKLSLVKVRTILLKILRTVLAVHEIAPWNRLTDLKTSKQITKQHWTNETFLKECSCFSVIVSV